MSQTPLKVGAPGAFLLTEKNFRKIMGCQDLWTLAGIAFRGGNVVQGQGSGHGQDRAMDTKSQQGRETCSVVDFDNNRIWVPLLTQAVGSLLSDAAREKLLAEKPGFVEDALDLLFSCTNRENRFGG